MTDAPDPPSARRLQRAMNDLRRDVAVVPVGATLFHGTGEDFDGDLAPGGDGVAWFSDSPQISQLYVPASGSSMIFRARALQLPTEDDNLRLVQRAVGICYDYDRVRWGRTGRAESFWPPEGWADLPTEADVERLLEERGWRKSEDTGAFTVRFHGDRLLPPGDVAPGRLFVAVVREPLRVWRKATGESDLTDLQYRDIAGFDAAREDGLDGVIIDDFAQSDRYGNVGHLSLGLFSGALGKLDFTSVPARYREWDRGDAIGTPEHPDPPRPFLRTLLTAGRRANPAAPTTLYVRRQADESSIAIFLYETEDASHLTRVARLRAMRVPSLGNGDDADCRASVARLRPSQRGDRPYAVKSAYVSEAWRGRGLGAWLYAEAARLAREIDDAPIVADACAGGETSMEAEALWRGRALRSNATVDGFAALGRAGARETPPPRGLLLRPAAV